MANDTEPNRSVPPRSREASPRSGHFLPRGRNPGVGRLGAIVVVLAVVAGALGWSMAGRMFDASPGGSGGGSGGPGPGGGPGTGGGSVSPGAHATPAAPAPAPTPTPRPPTGGTELYGYLPYWQMNDRIAAYLDQVPVTTLALFSVSPASNGGLRKNETGYRRITGDRGRGLIADAHARGQRVELVFTSFGASLNTRLFSVDLAGQARREKTVSALVALAVDLGVDGIDVDVEAISGDISVGYVEFMGALRSGLKALGKHATLTAATTAGHTGAVLAWNAVVAGADRVFLMGYEYHWSGSGPGASAPIHNRDPGLDLTQSIVDYVETGVPRDRILLGLPLYGMTWRVVGPDRYYVVVGKGKPWIPASHADLLTSADFTPTLDPEEIADYFLVQDGETWLTTYYDSPRSLRPKLELAREQGLAGSGFWALGYDYGLPGYVQLMRDFRAGRIGG